MSDKVISSKERLDLAEKNLEILLEWVGRFDNKSSVVLGIDTAMLGVLGASAPKPSLWTFIMILLAAISIVFISISLLFIYLGNYPRLKGSDKSLFYFGSICKYNCDKYHEEFSKLSAEECLKDLLEQCHRNSQIISMKFYWLKWAYRTLFIGVFPWGITLYLFRSIP